MYNPQKLYGFCEAAGEKVFFHLESFAFGAGDGGSQPPPPIVGESVIVTYNPDLSSDKAPKALSVQRVSAPTKLVGIVETFMESKGWGFILGTDGASYHLHRSEVEGGKLPLPGCAVEFYRGFRKERLRACYVKTI